MTFDSKRSDCKVLFRTVSAMRIMQKKITIISILVAAMCLMISSACADLLTLPANIKSIESEAFYKNTSIVT